MDLNEQQKQFYQTIAPSRPNEWEVEEIFEKLQGVESGYRKALLSQVAAIWPVSHSLCFSFLECGVEFAAKLSPEMYPEWVRFILAIYEKQGLVGARQYMSDVERYFLQPLQGKAGVGLDDITGKLVHFLRGISGLSFALEAAPHPYTDTTTIYLPERLQLFPGNNENFLLYKLIAVLQYNNIASGLFHQMLKLDNKEIRFAQYSDEDLAKDIFGILQFGRNFRSLQRDFPGLYRKAKPLCLQLIEDIGPKDAVGKQHNVLRSLMYEIISGKVDGADMDQSLDLFDQLDRVYYRCVTMSGGVSLGNCRLLTGSYDFKKTFDTILFRRKDAKGRFIGLMSSFLEDKNPAPGQHNSLENNGTEELVDSLVVFLNNEQNEGKARKQSVKIENNGFDLPDDLMALSREIVQDLGSVPEAYVQAAVGVAGAGVVKRQQENNFAASPFEFTGKEAQATVYDEWDYRRDGYRKNWCLLYEKTLGQVRSNFVDATVAKYRSQHDMLKRQFEMLRTQDRFCRRRRDGDEIDFDALVDALGDSRAGLTPSERLFIRLIRDTRDISTLFLVDMSNSTEGWVGIAMKEALVLMTEVMKILNDPYGIYGFSGMKRSKSELYHIKHLEEPYSDMVQQRLAAISPKEYTRMGPPIRHLTQRLLSFESKVRLLILISDGKPEDYDGYDGKYAIEDTRKALLEARGCGVRSFCITIDKANHDYLQHMFGHGNYLFVDNIKKLPLKMAEMYRLISS